MWIRNPAEWGAVQIAASGHALRSIGRAMFRPDVDKSLAPQVRRISFADLRNALGQGFDDFLFFRDDVIFICLIYPAVGLALTWAISHSHALPLLFPVFAGFALIGPFAAVWLYEMSRRRERGEKANWIDGFKAFASQSAAEIFKLGLLLIAIYGLWILAAWKIYVLTIGPEMPASLTSLTSNVFTTHAGWTMIAVGCGVGFIFALVVFAISVVSFPLLLDRKVTIFTAIATSIRACEANPGPMLAWGLIIATGLALGMLSALTALIVVLPVLGHATWRLYRKVVV
ncbi:DUF2189 domain-containing protein [Rhodoblastus acidophilus]|uniref:DUF2189 domain-containing protein n=1 Tax=Candidatus Rhodoblastus alkanivorans TaxID=2954117 RepID=A0ABS9Z901_9HYPH|nr:DUF2189 domain-containing protein [Candidatus Rhodoblastus alkanivorans]MCI4678916.1 DUF2189 domain-containing protein [Candidatus Rhodoblastus alkanivorans]MCI4684160.1 DUF2189 domain-containing protein [Candidatus Rhodoblastus alkanivorans]MDI4641481.1 DUF2189 domain-containing protein [Rhodoblastus acidophilus]